MPSVLKTLLDNLSSKISVNTSDITEINNRLNDVDSGVTLEEYITTNNSNISKLQSDLQSAGTDISSIESDVAEISSGLTSVRSEVTTARGGSASLDDRLDAMTTATENAASAASAAQTAAEEAQSTATTAQTTANEAATNANTANSNIAAAADTFDSLKARLDDMTTNITNVTDDAGANTDDIASINSEISRARRGFDNLYLSIGEADFSGFGKILSPGAKTFWLNYSHSVTNYYTAAGVSTTSDDPEAAYTIVKYTTIPTSIVISIANILTVTSDTLLASSLPPITVDGTLYTVYFIRLPNIEFNSNYSVNNAYLNAFPAIIGPSDPAQITMDMIGNTNSSGKIGLTASNANLYLPVLRPSTSPGTVFKFLYTAIDPDTNTVQYLAYNSQITLFL